MSNRKCISCQTYVSPNQYFHSVCLKCVTKNNVQECDFVTCSKTDTLYKTGVGTYCFSHLKKIYANGQDRTCSRPECCERATHMSQSDMWVCVEHWLSTRKLEPRKCVAPDCCVSADFVGNDGNYYCEYHIVKQGLIE